jgi:hypothetical protein
MEIWSKIGSFLKKKDSTPEKSQAGIYVKCRDEMIKSGNYNNINYNFKC